MPKPHHDKDRLLRTFVAVARSGSLRHAAFAMDITQAAASKQVSALEALLDTRLFDRHGRGMRLTSTGQRLLAETGDGFDRIDAALGHAPEASGQIAIATVNTLAAYLLPQAVARLRALHPRLRVRVTTASSPEVVEQVARGQADLGLVYDLAVDTDAVALQRLCLEDLSAFCRRDATLPEAMTLEALAREPLILAPRPYALRRLVDRSLPAPLNVAVECNSVSVSLDLVAHGAGVAVLPSALPAEMVALRGLRRVALQGADLRRPVVLIHRRTSAALPPRVQEAMALMHQCVKPIAPAD